MSYTLLSETKLPYHEGDEHATTIRMYDVSDETLEYLRASDNPELDIMYALNLQDDHWVMPGALYHRYDATLFGRAVIVADTVACNV